MGAKVLERLGVEVAKLLGVRTEGMGRIERCEPAS